MECDHREND